MQSFEIEPQQPFPRKKKDATSSGAAFSRQEENWFKEGEGKNWEELLERQAAIIGFTLSDAIGKINPARIADLRSEERIETALLGEIRSMGEIGLGGVSKPLELEIGDSRMSGVYKPVTQEERVSGMHGIKEGTLAQREWLAYQIDKIFGLNIVPPTVLRRGKSGLGSVQQWKIGFQIGNTPEWKSKASKRDLAVIAFLDRLTNNMDRNVGNALIDETGRLWAIDNSLSFKHDIWDHLGRDVSPTTWAGRNLPLPEDVVSNVESYLANPVLQAALQEAFKFSLGNDWRKEWEYFVKKVKEL